MDSLRDRILGFSWIPSFIVSILAGLVFFLIENPRYVPQSLTEFAQLLFQYSVGAVAITGVVVGCLSLYYNQQQKRRWDRFEEELRERSRQKENKPNDITKSSTELLLDWIEKVDDLLWISEDGEVSITANNLNDAQKIILYLIGVRYAFELELIDSPEVGTDEIAKKAKVPQMTVRGWYLPLDDVVDKRHLEIWERYSEDEDGFFDQFQLNVKNVDKAFHYVTDDEDSPEPVIFG